MSAITSYTSINANAAPFVPGFPSAQYGLQLPANMQRKCSLQTPQYQSPCAIKQQQDEAQQMFSNTLSSLEFSGKSFEALPCIDAKPFNIMGKECDANSSGFSSATKASTASAVDSADSLSGLSDYEDELPKVSVTLKKAESEQQGQWKSKVRTELCKFWLRGQVCENRDKEQGCGFAHGEHELQPKHGLNEKYLTSVCKNFLENPSKCSYGDRCIFQHPSMDPRVKQPIEAIFRENIKYTAMRLFQNIPGADVVYINAYALQTPRLSAFKSVAPSRGKTNKAPVASRC